MSFHTVFTEATANLARRVKHASTLRLFIVLPEDPSYTDWRRIAQDQLAKELDTTQASISRALAELLTLEVIERKGRGPVTEWRLSSDYGWRGTVDQFHEHRRARQQPKPHSRPASPVPIAAEGRLWKFAGMRLSGDDKRALAVKYLNLQHIRAAGGGGGNSMHVFCRKFRDLPGKSHVMRQMAAS